MNPDYESKTVPIEFTMAEIDMLFFASLAHIGHPEAEGWQLKDSGMETLLSALQKIQDYNQTLALSGEPEIVSPE